jgi:hypothetical protein
MSLRFVSHLAPVHPANSSEDPYVSHAESRRLEENLPAHGVRLQCAICGLTVAERFREGA